MGKPALTTDAALCITTPPARVTASETRACSCSCLTNVGLLEDTGEFLQQLLEKIILRASFSCSVLPLACSHLCANPSLQPGVLRGNMRALSLTPFKSCDFPKKMRSDLCFDYGCCSVFCFGKQRPGKNQLQKHRAEFTSIIYNRSGLNIR